jgi:S-methyl-5-thioribose-1-phosphate isomerase
MIVNGTPYRTVWLEERCVCAIEQRLLPHTFSVARLPTHRETAAAIRDMLVRGAPCIGATAAYGLAQAALEAPDDGFIEYLREADARLRATRPTAQNLFFALDRIMRAITAAASPANARSAAVAEANALADEDVAACKAIGDHGAKLLQDGMTVLTHCNAGWLATVDWGTALAPIYVATRAGMRLTVLADETRPRSQGSKLTAWELMQEGIDVHVIADNAAGFYLQRGEVDLVITGADRIAANGDVANKIGTYAKAVVAHANGVPFYVAAPRSTFDFGCASGADIPIEERDASEVTVVNGVDASGTPHDVFIAPRDAKARNPAFDVTPARYVAGLITENGIFDASSDALQALR